VAEMLIIAAALTGAITVPHTEPESARCGSSIQGRRKQGRDKITIPKPETA